MKGVSSRVRRLTDEGSLPFHFSLSSVRRTTEMLRSACQVSGFQFPISRQVLAGASAGQELLQRAPRAPGRRRLTMLFPHLDQERMEFVEEA